MMTNGSPSMLPLSSLFLGCFYKQIVIISYIADIYIDIFPFYIYTEPHIYIYVLNNSISIEAFNGL